MLDRSTVDRLRSMPITGSVVSVYLGLPPDLDQLRTLATRVKALVQPLRESDPDRACRSDLDRVVELADQAGGDLGRGAAFFVSGESGLEEKVSLPVGVRDRAIVDATPYLGPLEAILSQQGWSVRQERKDRSDG